LKTINLKDGSILELNKGYNIDCLELMKQLPDKSIGLIMADPPYFEVKGDFDFVWDSFDDYLKDVEKWAMECKRILQDNGSLFWWGDARKIAYSQIILDKYFKLENSIVWRKTECQTRRMDFEIARRFAPVTERLLFYSNDFEPSEWNQTGTERIKEEFLKPKNPFAIYMREEFKKAKINNKEISKLFPSKTGGLTGCVSNWVNGDNIPTKEQYLKIREFLNNEYLREEYEDLREEYEDLRKEYEDLRRPFNNLTKLEDVITHSQESSESRKYEHETIKAVGLIKKLLTVTTRKETLVFIPFWGSGTDSSACYELGLNWLATETSDKHFLTASNRQKDIEKQAILDF